LLVADLHDAIAVFQASLRGRAIGHHLVDHDAAAILTRRNTHAEIAMILLCFHHRADERGPHNRNNSAQMVTHGFPSRAMKIGLSEWSACSDAAMFVPGQACPYSRKSGAPQLEEGLAG